MDRITAFVSAAIGTGLALRFGPGVGQSMFPYEATAALRGMGLVGGGGAFGSYVLLQRLRYDIATSFAFAAVVAYYYGEAVGYRFFFCTSDLQAKIYGMPMTFVVAGVPGELIVWPIVRNIGNSVRTSLYQLGDAVERNVPTMTRPGATRRGTGATRETPEQLWESIEGGLTLTYASRIDRDFTYFDTRNRKTRLRMQFTLQRDTMAMTPRERAAVFIFRMLKQYGCLDAQTIDRFQFGLTWGNGACSSRWTNFKSDPQVLQPLGFRTGEDVIRHEAAMRAAGVESIISELFGILRAWATAKNAPEELVKLHRSYSNPGPRPGGDGGQWS